MATSDSVDDGDGDTTTVRVSEPSHLMVVQVGGGDMKHAAIGDLLLFQDIYLFVLHVSLLLRQLLW